jgi:hypothetical protein
MAAMRRLLGCHVETSRGLGSSFNSPVNLL